ncbi:hypothetical protein C7451_102105 [Blastomonas natatoria]|uniref:DUF1993 domain-containing protein n=1 Tax=Blastomonas natatoria TaxID=34015 RepID=A0A2V3VB92_9SPHN|nr:DUF1993 domain-containing protein [Blastomonas natatoria]PXW78434.1 hypothetical protein C7451_102105 [Blastomonas natatoria]
MTLKDLLVPTFVPMLGALSTWLSKAEQHGTGDRSAELMQARLAPDMFPLFTQICFACVQAQEAMARLRGQEFPDAIAELRGEGVDAGAKVWTIADAQARIAGSIAIVEAAADDLADVAADMPIAHALPIGMIFDFTAAQYARDWAIPQFYFHVMTAYAILRGQGVPLGKIDYVGHLMPYLRPGTIPQRS